MNIWRSGIAAAFCTTGTTITLVGLALGKIFINHTVLRLLAVSIAIMIIIRRMKKPKWPSFKGVNPAGHLYT